MHQSRGSIWVVDIVFVLVGILCCFILPALLTPKAGPNAIRVPGVVESIGYQILPEDTEPVTYPVFSFTLPDGTTSTFRSDITSDHSLYEVGEKITVVVDPADPSTAFAENDKNLAAAILISRFIGAIFLMISSVVLLLLLRGADTALVSRVGGLMGALSFGIPAASALPGLWILYQSRPNIAFSRTDAFDQETIFIGALFSTLGIITILASLALYRYQAKTGRPGWAWAAEWIAEQKEREKNR